MNSGGDGVGEVENLLGEAARGRRLDLAAAAAAAVGGEVPVFGQGQAAVVGVVLGKAPPVVARGRRRSYRSGSIWNSIRASQSQRIHCKWS